MLKMGESEAVLPMDKTRLKKVKNILVSQPEPDSNSDNPYRKLQERYGINVDFFKFIQVESVNLKEFKQQKINILDHSAVIFTSRKAVDYFFSIAKQCKIEIPVDMKYFCVSKQTSNYLHKYIVIKKRKIFVGERSAKDLLKMIDKHKEESFLYPCSNIRTDLIPDHLTRGGYNWKELLLYRTLTADLSCLEKITYDIIAFFSPSGINSLLHNFPEFRQNNTRIAAFGNTTALAVKKAGLILDIQAPLPNAPSMAGAIEYYINQIEKNGTNK